MGTRTSVSGQLTRRRLLRGAALLPAIRLFADTAPESFKVYTDSPRLFLRSARLRLLRRERERHSLRWEQFETLWSGAAEFPEFGWTAALRYQIAQDEAAGKQAIGWGVTRASARGAVSENVVRQLALIADWCGPLMQAADKTVILGRLERYASAPVPPAGVTLAEARTRTLAAIAISESRPAAAEKALRDIYEIWWMKSFIPGLLSGKLHVPNPDANALLELMHAFRDNLDFDLRETCATWYRDYGPIHILAHYPEPFPAPENEYRIPADPQVDQRGPDITKATLSRAAELAMVAYDANAAETQLLQGFLMNDRFLMRGTLGIAYELMWADPYQPGLSYYHVPLVAHDSIGGELYVRSTWEDDAQWLGFFGGQLQLFGNGDLKHVDPQSAHDPMDLQEATVFFARVADKFRVPQRAAPPRPPDADPEDTADSPAIDDVFIIGLQPGAPYHVEVDGEGMFEAASDPGGIIYAPSLPAGAQVRFELTSLA
ncbi:MAG TPA: hypothetical protein VHC90_17870 [Bryobacteraceae bacterium]|nr:hypothetical protein [Bryobacteraceae bacterium]